MTGGKEAEHQKQWEEKKNMERKESGNKVWGVLKERNEQQRERRLDEQSSEWVRKYIWKGKWGQQIVTAESEKEGEGEQHLFLIF